MTLATALVTGGAGFIGSHLVRALLERGAKVRVLDNFSSGRRENLRGLEVEIVTGDVTDQPAVEAAAAGCTHLVHLAALTSVPQSVADPARAHHVNVTGTLNALLAARAQGMRRLVFASSSAVYGDLLPNPKHEAMALYPLSPYGVTKLAGEKYCASFHASYGLEAVALRYFNVFGPRQDPRSEYAAVIPRFIQALLQGRRPTIYGDGEQTRDFVHVADVVQANLRALEAEAAGGQAFNVAGGAATNLNQLAALLAEAAGQPVQPEYAAPRPGDIRHSTADIHLAQERLGYEPTVSLREGLAETLRWFQAHPEALA